MLPRGGGLCAQTTDELELVEEELALGGPMVEGRVDLDLTLLGELDGVDAQRGASDGPSEVLLTTGILEEDRLGGVDAESGVVPGEEPLLGLTARSLVVVAAATSVLDLFASLAAARRGEGSLAVSIAICSNTFDLLICIAHSFGIIGGQHIVGDVALSGGFLLPTVVVLIGLTQSGWSVMRSKGAILLGLYLRVFLLVVSRTFFGFPKTCPLHPSAS